MDTIKNRLDEIHAMKIEICACGIVDNRFTMIIHLTTIEYGFVVMIIIINGHQVPAQTIATKINIIKVKSIILQLLIRSSDASSDAHTVIYIKLYDAVIAGTFLRYPLEIESIIGIIDYDMDAIDPMTVEIGLFSIIDYDMDAIDPITVQIGFISKNLI